MGNVHMEATQINYRGGSKKMSVEEAIKAAGTEITPEEKEWIDTIPELASQEIIAPEFDAEEGVYAVGDLVIYQGGLYQFTTAHETAGDWNPEEVAAVKISDELDALKSGLTNYESKIEMSKVVGWSDNYNLQTWRRTLTADTVNGVTYTPVFDKYGDLLQINLSGTADGASYFGVGSTNLNAGLYIINGVTGGSVSTYYMDYNYGSIAKAYNGDATMVIQSDNTSVSCFINVQNGVNVDGVVIKPMIRLSGDSSVYVPNRRIIGNYILPKAPTTDGVYVLKATVASGTPIYSWESAS